MVRMMKSKLVLTELSDKNNSKFAEKHDVLLTREGDGRFSLFHL